MKGGNMRPAIVRLIDLGHQSDFALAMSFAENIIQSLTARPAGSPPAEVEFIRTRDLATVKAALQSRAHILHITAHGHTEIGEIGFLSEDDESRINLNELAEQFYKDGEGIEAGVIFADACDTGQGRFIRAIRDCVEEPVIYIGARRSVDWHETTTFASAFYASYFKDRGMGLSLQDRGWAAADRAFDAYELMVAGNCPFTVQELEPSRKAKRGLSGS